VPKTYPVRNSFNTGEISPLVEFRDDVQKYSSACLTLENSMPLVEGGAKKMPGTTFAGATARGGSMFTASISGNDLTVSSTTYGTIRIGDTVVGPGVTAGTTITGQATNPGVPIYTNASASGSGAQGVTSGDWQFVGSQFRTLTEPTTTTLGQMTILCPVTVPAGAQILGVVATVDLVSQFGSAATVTAIALWNGSQLGTAKTPGTGFTTTPINTPYGASSDLWGNTSAALLAALPSLALSVAVTVPDSTRIFVGIVQPTVTVYYRYQSGTTPPVPIPNTYTISISQTVGSELMQTPTTGKSRLVPFQFSTAQGAFLELSAGLIRIWEGATSGSWALGLALQPPAASNFSPLTTYVPSNVALVGPFAPTYFFTLGGHPRRYLPDPTRGVLTIASPYGTTNAQTVSITFTVNSSDTLSATVTGSSPNQGINIALANTSPGNNSALAIQAAIQALATLNPSTSNSIDLTQWTATGDPIYTSSPWTVTPQPLPEIQPYFFVNSSQIVEATAGSIGDQFPFLFDGSINSAFWEIFNVTSESPIELITPYAEADLFALDCSTQSADVLWIFHPSYPPPVVERQAANQWSYSLSLPGQQPNEPAYRGTLDVVKTGYSGLGQNISLISQSNPCTLVLASPAGSPPFTVGDRVYINLCAGLVELNQGEFIVNTIAYQTGSITVIDSTGTSSTVSGTGWFVTLNDPNTGAAIDSSSYLQYQGGGFAVQVVPFFSAPGSYPACGTLYQERLCVGGADSTPTQLNGSVEDDYPDFISDPNADDYAIQYTLVSNQVNQLLNMIGTPNALLIGTSGGVWVVTGTNGGALTQLNVDANIQTSLGVSPLQPQLVNGNAIFVSRSTRIVTFLVFSFVSNTWESNDLTRLNRDITIADSESTSGIAQTAFQMEPYPIFWAVRNDGQLIGLIFNAQDQVYAWFRVDMTAQGGFIESCSVITSAANEDQLAVIVRRTVNGVSTRFVEYFMPQELFHQLSNAFFVHSGLQLDLGPAASIASITQANPPVVTTLSPHGFTTGEQVQITAVQGMTQINQFPSQAYTITVLNADQFSLNGMDSTAFSAYTSGGIATPVTDTVTGLNYLLGNTVTAVGDGALILPNPTTVTSDSLTFPYYANQITVGIPYTLTIQPTNPVLSQAGATTRSLKQKINRISLSLYEAMGGFYGEDLDHMYPIQYDSSTLSLQPSMFDGDSVVRDTDDDWTNESTFFITQSDPLPFTLRGIVFRLTANE